MLINLEENRLDSERTEEKTKGKFVLILLWQFDYLKQGGDEVGERSAGQGK